MRISSKNTNNKPGLFSIFFTSIIEWIRYKLPSIQYGPVSSAQPVEKVIVAFKFLPEILMCVLVVFCFLSKSTFMTNNSSMLVRYASVHPSINYSLYEQVTSKAETQDIASMEQSEDSESEAPSSLSYRPTTAFGSSTDLSEGDSLHLSARSPDDIQKAVLDKIKNHVVVDGENVDTIGKLYNVTPETIMWTNQLTSKKLEVGTTLKILPVDGILVRFSDNSTLRDIANKYQGKLNEIMAYNGFLDENEPDVDQLVICPHCVVPKEVPKPKIQTPRQSRTKPLPVEYSNLAILDDELFDGSGTSHAFAPGNCTWFAAKHFPVKFAGHAKYWLGNAKRAGYSTGNIPEVGAVASLDGNARYGHVGLVVEVTDTQVKIREMNYRRLYQITERWIPIGSGKINGYIYRP